MVLIHRPNYIGDSILQHKSRQFIQRGYGIGSIFNAFKRWIVPVTKNILSNVSKVGKKILANPTVRDVAKAAKDEALRMVTDVAASAIAGDSIKDTISTSIDNARPKIANAVRRIRPIEDEEEEQVEQVQMGSGVRKRRRKEKVYDDIFNHLRSKN